MWRRSSARRAAAICSTQTTSLPGTRDGTRSDARSWKPRAGPPRSGSARPEGWGREMAMRVALLVLLLLLAASVTDAQQAPKPWRLGYLAASVGAAPHEALRAALRDLGYVEGQNLVVETRFAHAKFERLAQLALEL